MKRLTFRNDEQGSVAMTAIVALIASGLALAMVFTAETGLRASRRAGDSASALQAADAGINAAAQFIPNVPASTTSIGPTSASVGAAKYTYWATKQTPRLWDVISVGEDRGLRRQVHAQAVAEPVFGRPILIRLQGSLKAGTILDSYISGDTPQNRCTKQGILTVNDPLLLDFTGTGGGNANCQALVWDSSWTHSMDGCHIPGDEDQLLEPLPPLNNQSKPWIGKAMCPDPPLTTRVTPNITPAGVTAPKAYDFPKLGDGDPLSTSYVCDASTGTNRGPLEAGKTYYYSSVTLLDGCIVKGVTGTTQPVQVYSYTIDIGVDKKEASANIINPPKTPFCPVDFDPKAALTGVDKVNATGFCAKWVGQLRLNLIPGEKSAITFRNKARFFWGLLYAPEGAVKINSEQLEIWGASVSSAMSSGTQFTWHFDEDLRKEIGIGRFSIKNWREEPVTK